MNISLRLAKLSDAQLIWEMQKTAFQELLERYRDYDTNPANEPIEKVENRLSQEARSYYFIDIDNEPIGAISVTDLKDGSNKKLAPLFILPQFQGCGYAQAAILAVEQIHGSNAWELDTILQEEKLCHLYEKMGYKKTGEIKPINENMSLVYYEKD